MTTSNLRLPKQGQFWPDSLLDLLSQLASMLDTVKSQDWKDCWSEYDQAQRDAIAAYMLALQDDPATLSETRSASREAWEQL